MPALPARRALIALLKGLLTFRVLMALTTSLTVTGAVAGPMAYQAKQARNEVVIAAPAPTTTTTSAPTPPLSAPVASTTSTTSTTTTTTTTTEAPPAPVPPGSAAPTTTTAPALTATGLLISVSRDHSAPKALQGSVSHVRAWLFFDGSGVTSVTYWLDDPTGTSEPIAVATSPFDVDPDGVVLATWGLGPHTLLAEVTTLDGTYRRLASFTIGS